MDTNLTFRTLLRRGAATVVAGFAVALAACSSEAPVGLTDVDDALMGAGTSSDGSLLLCKYTTDPTTQTFDFRVTASGGDVVGNGRFTLNAAQVIVPNAECVTVWIATDDGTHEVTIEEDVPPGWSIFAINFSETGFIEPLTNPVTIEVPHTGGVVFFKNEPTPFEPAFGRMTGGGGQIAIGDVYISRGFTIHCDITLSNNVNVVWHDDSNHWHIDKPLTGATCIDQPGIEPAPPPAPFDTFIGEGFGTLNGVDGSFIRFTFIDAGEPSGGGDAAGIEIWAPGDDPDVDDPVLSLPLSPLDNGNIQAHYDQPHGSNQNGLIG